MKFSSPISIVFAEGAIFGATIGFSGGLLLTSSNVTAEVGQIIWIIIVSCAALVIFPAEHQPLRYTVICCIPFYVSVIAALILRGAFTLPLKVVELALVGQLSVPLAAFTQSEMDIRHGIYFLFIILASLPAVISAVLVFLAIRSAIFTYIKRPSSARRSRVWLRRLWRSIACASIIALALNA